MTPPNVHFSSSPLCSLSFLVCRGGTDCWPSLSWFQWNGHILGWMPSEVAVVFFWTGYLTAKGWSVLEASLQSSLAALGREKTIKNETREGKQSRCFSKSSSLPDLSPYSGDRSRQKLPRGQSNELVPRYFALREGQCWKDCHNNMVGVVRMIQGLSWQHGWCAENDRRIVMTTWLVCWECSKNCQDNMVGVLSIIYICQSFRYCPTLLSGFHLPESVQYQKVSQTRECVRLLIVLNKRVCQTREYVRPESVLDKRVVC